MSVQRRVGSSSKNSFQWIRQYNSRKPTKKGLENSVLCGSSGIMYDFFYYTGTTRNEKYNSQVVKRLLEGLPKSKNYRLFFYNWFCTLDLCIMLKRMGLLSTTTVRVDRMKGLPAGNKTNNMGQGTRRCKCNLNSGHCVAV